MANVVYKNGLYNTEIKEKYLARYSANTVETIERLFKCSYEVENELNKDLYDFSPDEIKRVLVILRPKTLKSSSANGSVISNYLNWAIADGYSENESNPLNGLDMDWYKQFLVDKDKISFYREDEFETIVNKLVNAQDRATVQLIFEGVGAETFEELFNLRESDVNFITGQIFLTDKFGKSRTITVSKKCIEYIRGAIGQTEYIKSNGHYSGSRGSDTTSLVDAAFVIKKAYRANAETDKCDYFLLNRRTATIKDALDEPRFTAVLIRDSGMLRMARDFYIEYGQLTSEHLHIILERFNTNLVDIGGVLKRNIAQYKRAFLNVETLKELYPELD